MRLRAATVQLILCVLIVGLLGLPVTSAYAQSQQQVKSWASKVLLGPEFGGGGARVARWGARPTLSVFNATAQQRVVIDDTVAHLNETLAKTPLKGIRLLAPNDTRADIEVYFTQLNDMPRLASQLGFTYRRGNWGYFWTYWNNHRIHTGYVLLAEDRLSGDLLRHFALEEITQVLGPMNDSDQFADSIFFASPSRTTQLSPLDKKLLHFLYTRLKPGDGLRRFEAAFAKHW